MGVGVGVSVGVGLGVGVGVSVGVGVGVGVFVAVGVGVGVCVAVAVGVGVGVPVGVGVGVLVGVAVGVLVGVAVGVGVCAMDLQMTMLATASLTSISMSPRYLMEKVAFGINSTDGDETLPTRVPVIESPDKLSTMHHGLAPLADRKSKQTRRGVSPV